MTTPPQSPLVSDLLNGLGLPAPITEHDLRTECPICRRMIRLDRATVTRDQVATVYTCPEECGPILIITAPSDHAIPGSGYRITNKWVIRNPSDLLYLNGVMNASPRAFG